MLRGNNNHLNFYMPYLQISTSQTVEIECAQPFYKIEDETFIASHDSE